MCQCPEDSSLIKIFSIIFTVWVLAVGCSSKTKEEFFAEGMKAAANKPRNAIIFFKNALEKDQNYFDARFQLAKAYTAIEKFDAAEKEFLKAHRQRPDSKEVQIETARVHVRLSKADEALKELAEYVTDACNDPDILEIAGIANALKGNYGTSIGLLKRALATSNPQPSVELTLARVYMMSGNDDEANRLLTEILKKNPSRNHALSMLAELHVKKNETKEAIALYDQLLKNDPADGDAFYKEGILYIKNHNYDTAISLADQFIKQFPKKGEGLQLKGIGLFYNKNFADATIALQKSIAIQPTLIAHYYLGLCHYYKNEFEQSMYHLQQVLDLNPSFVQAHEILSLILLKKNRVDDAIDEIKKVLVNHDRDAVAYNILGSAYIAKASYKEGMEELNRALELDPNLIDAHLNKGILELNKGRADAAEIELNTAVRINPDLLETRLLLASHYIKRSTYEKAIQILKQGIKGQKTDAVFYNMMADAFMRENKVEEAIESLQKAKTAEPHFDAPYLKLASIYYYKHQHDKSIQELKSLYEMVPGNVKALLAMASIYEVEGNAGEAANCFRHARETGKTEGYVGLAAYYLRTKDQDKALSVFDEIIKKSPAEPNLYELKGKILIAQKRFSDAIRTFESLEKVNSQSGFLNLVNTYILMGSPEKALEKVVYALKKNPERLDLSSEVSKIYVLMGKRQDAIENAKQIMRSNPRSSVGYTTLAMIYKEGNELEEGIEVLTDASRIVNDTDLLIMLGNFYMLKKDYSRSLDCYRKVEAIKPDYIPALFHKGALFHALGKKKEAIAEYFKVLRLSQNNVAALNNAAYLYAEDNKDLPMALQLASRAYILAPDDGSVQDTLGFVLLKNEKFEESVKILRRAVEILPGNPSVHYHLALAYSKQKKNALAVEQIEKAIRSGEFPDSNEAKLLLAKLNGGNRTSK